MIHFTKFTARVAGGALFVLVAACAGAPLSLDPSTAGAVDEAMAADSAPARLKADVDWLADDAREGRAAGSPGYDAAARYVAGRFAALGLEPAGDKRGWFQQVTLRTVKRDNESARMAIIQKDGARADLESLKHFIISTAPYAEADLSAPVLFAGYGVTDPASGYDDYRGVDARGKIVAIFSGAPRSLDTEKRAHYGSGSEKLRNAAAHGAAGVIYLRTEANDKLSSWEKILKYADEPSMTWVRPDGAPESSAPSIRMRASIDVEAARKLFEGAQYSFDALRALEADDETTLESFNLPVTVEMSGVATVQDVTSSNVAGLIEGSDPALANELVVLTAHLDGVGADHPAAEAAEADLINNGALDNATGVAILIEAARAFKASNQPPARSILFLAVTAEEKGLLGADYFVHFPTTAPREIVANVNLDMPLVLFPFTDVIAFGAERSTLGPMVAEAAGSMNIALAEDPMPEQGLFTRSDHYRFVEKGVPSVFLIVGFGNGGEVVFQDFLKNHYHQPSDAPDLPIDYEAAARFAELNYRIARAVADAREKPRWKKGDFFGDLFDGEKDQP